MAEKINKALPELGQRSLLIGQTGSGKTNFAVVLLKALPFSPFVVYDTKEEPKFHSLPKHQIVETESERNDALNDENIDFVIVRPPARISNDPESMDQMLLSHYDDLHGVGAYCDEIYAFHRASGRSMIGLNSLLTRGRSRGITTIMSTQRPAWLSKFCYTESQKFFVFLLLHEDDRKHVAKFIPNYDINTTQPKHGFWQYSEGDSQPKLFSAVPLVKPPKQEYKDDTASSIGIARLKLEPQLRKVRWI